MVAFPDSVERIVIGRDPARCRILFSKRTRHVATEHCALERVLGRYRLLLNGFDEVLVDGRPGLDGEVLPARCELQLTHRGPRLQLERQGAAVDQPARGPGPRLLSLRPVLARLRHTRHLVILALIGAVLALGGGYASGRSAGQRDTNIANQAAEDVASLNRRLRGRLTALQRIVEEGGGNRGSGHPRLAALLEDARDSVYQVITRRRNGGEAPLGTAWVAGPGVLATNAHVAEHFDELEEGDQLIARRRNGELAHTVLRVTTHPASQAFSRLWQRYRPAVGTRIDGLRGVRSAGPHYDVALCHVEDPDRLGPALPIADERALSAARPGDVLATLGFPTEGIAFGGAPVTHPVAQSQFGHITALSTPFGYASDWKQNTLIQHSCPATGGSSGSPVLNASGQVVALVNAGNVAYGWRGRFPTGVGIGYAQRVDMLQELLRPGASRPTPEREAEWMTALEAVYVSGYRMARTPRMRRLRQEHAFALFEERGGADYVWWTDAHEERVHIPHEDDTDPVVIELTATRGGNYLLTVSPEWGIQARVALTWMTATGKQTRVVTADPWGQTAARIACRRGSVIRVELDATIDSGEATLRLAEEQRTDASVDDSIGAIVRQCIAAVEGRLELGAYEPRQVRRVTKTLGRYPGWEGTVEIPEKGWYVIVFCAQEREDRLGLLGRLSWSGRSTGRTIQGCRAIGSAFEAKQTGESASFNVYGPEHKGGMPIEMRLFRLVEVDR